MKLTILGAGTAASGLPATRGHDYPPGFLVEWSDQKILFECSEGIKFRLQQAGYNYADIHHIAISHSHPDHNMFLPYLQAVYLYGMWGGEKNEEIHLYAPEFIIDNLPKLWDLYWQATDKPKFHQFSHLQFHVVPRTEAIAVGDGKLFAEKVYHELGQSDAVAFRLETPEGIFAYSGDTGDCAGIRTISKNAAVLVCEATATIGDETSSANWGHLNPRQAGEIAKEAGAKKLILFHYTGKDSEEAMIANCKLSEYEGEIIIGKDFQTFNI
jgi:ribonuclease BN (tRNA processing enzyme)